MFLVKLQNYVKVSDAVVRPSIGVFCPKYGWNNEPGPLCRPEADQHRWLQSVQVTLASVVNISKNGINFVKTLSVLGSSDLIL